MGMLFFAARSKLQTVEMILTNLVILVIHMKSTYAAPAVDSSNKASHEVRLIHGPHPR
jgi:hypothetical protein